LVDQRFAKAGRQGHERIACVEDGKYRRFLMGVEPLNAKGPARRVSAAVEQADASA
jgi:hypothetical protein